MPPIEASSTGVRRADAQRNRARILDAAERVFSDRGAAASTEEVARRAGVAIGTVFRHFPTKNDLLGAIMKRLLQRLVDEAVALADGDQGGDALFVFFTRTVERAAAKRTVVDLLTGNGVDVSVTDSVSHLDQAVDALLIRARSAGTVAADVRLPEVMALLASVCHGALHGGWNHELRERTLAIVFAGLNPQTGPTADRT